MAQFNVSTQQTVQLVHFDAQSAGVMPVAYYVPHAPVEDGAFVSVSVGPLAFYISISGAMSLSADLDKALQKHSARVARHSGL